MRRVRATILVLTLLAVAAPPAAAAGRGPGIVWSPCAQDATARCGTVSVPIDWADPYTARVGVAVAERPATDPSRRIGVLIVNPGGPGASGVDLAVGAASFFTPELRARFDIVGFDPRGVRRSHPVVCTKTLVDQAPKPLISSAAGYDAVVAYNRALAADCRRRTGPLFDHVDTLSVVRDMEALRAALGEEKINFYGASYGTLLGAQYADRYPARVRALVLDSVMDHSASIDDFLTTESAAAQDAFDEFVAWCARDTQCALRGRDIRALWAGLLARAEAGTLRDPYHPDRVVTPSDLLAVAFSSFYQPQWYALAFYLKEASASPAPTAGRAHRAARAPVAPAPPRWAGLGPASVAPRRVAADQAEYPFPAVFCADWALSVDGYAGLAAKLAAARGRAPQMLVSPLALSATVGCLGWPSAPANPQGSLRPASTPVLLVNARHDPATAYAWAQRVAGQLGPRARLLEYLGWGHVAYGRSACLNRFVDSYLIDGRTPAAGSECPAVPPSPFGVGGSGP